MHFEEKNPYIPELSGWALLGMPFQLPNSLKSITTHHLSQKGNPGSVGWLMSRSSVGSPEFV